MRNALRNPPRCRTRCPLTVGIEAVAPPAELATEAGYADRGALGLCSLRLVPGAGFAVQSAFTDRRPRPPRSPRVAGRLSCTRPQRRCRAGCRPPPRSSGHCPPATRRTAADSRGDLRSAACTPIRWTSPERTRTQSGTSSTSCSSRNTAPKPSNGPRPAPLNDFESPLEEQIAAGLVKLGWRVHPQIGVSGYRIDLGVVDPENDGRYLAGIEADGAIYHSAAGARERDKIRQAALEARGWTMLRVWSTDWWANPAGETVVSPFESTAGPT